MEIVRLPAEDWKDYRALRLRALKEDPQAFSSSYAHALELAEEFWQGRLRDALKGERNWLLFAREGGNLVGMIGAFVDESSTDVATIVSVYVPVEERGKGISTRLMKSMLDELSKRPFLKTITLTVNKNQLAAVHLYNKFGFQPTGTATSLAGDGSLVDEIVMERDLAN